MGLDSGSSARSFSQANDLDVGGLEPGVRVIHKKFGKGTIVTMVPENDDYRIEIDFDEFGMKRLMASFAKLKQAD